MHPKHLQIADFSYHLPNERIAAYPLPDRDASKLLVYKKGKISEDIYRNIPGHLPSDALMIFNNTRVIEARLLFQKPTGGMIEIFCLEPHEQYGDIATAMLQEGKVWWKCMIGGASKWKHGMLLHKGALTASIVEHRPDCFVVEFTWTPATVSFADMLHATGDIPLPPYIKRKAETLDSERYQTVYAADSGSVAAPTAGLHFTDELLQRLGAKNIRRQYVTLHVGAGTFKPVKSATVGEHGMHAEFMQVNIEVIQALYGQLGNTIVAVGTTSLRTIESLYWIAVKVMQRQQDINIYQWDPYDTNAAGITAKEALQALLSWMREHHLKTLTARTQLLIAPGYDLKIANVLVTNFHQPQSTLLLLVAAVAGSNWKSMYDYALEHGFRFLSYGDGCLIYKD